MVRSDEAGGVKPMNIAGRTIRERERLLGMTDAERKFRAQWLKDQHLSPNEPRVVPELLQLKYNPIRRFYRAPLDALERMIAPSVGPSKALFIRYFLGKGLIITGLAYGLTYYALYNSNNWEKKGGWKAVQSKQSVLPGDPGYPKLSDKNKPSDYDHRGFKDVTLNL